MGFKLGDIIVDRVQYAFAESLKGDPLYVLTQLQDVSVNITADSTDAVDNQGTLIKRFWKAKSGELTANNAMINLNIAAAAAGEGSVVSSDGTMFMPKIINATNNASKNATVKLGETADIAEDSIKVSLFTNGAKGDNFEKETAASPTKFAYSEGTVTLPEVEGTFIIKYERKVKADAGVKIVNRGDKFPSTVKLTLKALVVDPCDVATLRAAYIVIPSFQVSPELEISLTTDGQLQYSGQMQMNYCSEEKALYEIYYADDDENEEK